VFIKNRVSIDERPSVVEKKSRIGDWEIDLVIGKEHSGALVAIVERKTSFTVSKRVNDNKEFVYHEEMTTQLKCRVYFADPYCSCQRGLNENTNGLLRLY
jgi:IS30 family transposase